MAKTSGLLQEEADESEIGQNGGVTTKICSVDYFTGLNVD